MIINSNIFYNSLDYIKNYSEWDHLKYVALIICFLLLVPSIHNQIRFHLLIRRDYKLARGTLHKKQLSKSLKLLNGKIKKFEKTKKNILVTIQHLDGKRNKRLKKELSSILVHSRLTDVEGIRQILKERIIHNCFDGSLNSLRRASVLEGIGEQKYSALMNWVKEMENKMPYLLEKDFPNKNKINEEFKNEELQLKKQQRNIEEQIAPMNELKKIASTEMERLNKVNISHFKRCYKSNNESMEYVNNYLNGIFPEWAPMPKWFKILISDFGS